MTDRLRERWGPYAYDHLPIELDDINVTSLKSDTDTDINTSSSSSSPPYASPPNPSTSILPSPKRVQTADGSRRRYGFLHRPCSRSERIILDFYPLGCCGAGMGVNEIDAQRIPPQIQLKGVSNDDWVRWMKKLHLTVQSKQTCGGIWFEIISWILIFPLFWLCYQRSRYQRALTQWLSAFNTQILEPNGMYASTQTAIFHTDKYHEEISWLAIATTPNEILLLRQEDHIWKYQFGSPCCHQWCCNTCPEEDRIVPKRGWIQYSACCCGPQRMV